jgi:hypothetical protein
MVARGDRIVLDALVASWALPEMTRKSQVANDPSVPALTMSDSDRLPRSRPDTGER